MRRPKDDMDQIEPKQEGTRREESEDARTRETLRWEDVVDGGESSWPAIRGLNSRMRVGSSAAQSKTYGQRRDRTDDLSVTRLGKGY